MRSWDHTQRYLPPNRGDALLTPLPWHVASTHLSKPEGWKAELTLEAGYTEMVYPEMITHPTINRARRTVTTLIETNALPPNQASTNNAVGIVIEISHTNLIVSIISEASSWTSCSKHIKDITRITRCTYITLHTWGLLKKLSQDNNKQRWSQGLKSLKAKNLILKAKDKVQGWRHGLDATRTRM